MDRRVWCNWTVLGGSDSFGGKVYRVEGNCSLGSSCFLEIFWQKIKINVHIFGNTNFIRKQYGRKTGVDERLLCKLNKSSHKQYHIGSSISRLPHYDFPKPWSQHPESNYGTASLPDNS